LKVDPWVLSEMQAFPLALKLRATQHRIIGWHRRWGGKVYVAFSGGKDSTVLLDIVRRMYPDVPAVFANTGLEYPEIVEFVKQVPNVVFVRPRMSFKQVLETYGYPVVSKRVSMQVRVISNPTPYNKASRTLYRTGVKRDGTRSRHFALSRKWHFLLDAPFKISEKCCDVMKKEPLNRYGRESRRCAIIGSLASEGEARRASYLQAGCNNYSKKTSNPMSFWRTEDVWEYIRIHNLPYSHIYQMGATRTGCIFCMFGLHREKEPNRFQKLHKTHPQLYCYCMGKLGLGTVLAYLGIPVDHPDIRQPGLGLKCEGVCGV